MDRQDSKLHVVVTTHTALHLGPTLWGLANQTPQAARIFVALDGDDSALLNAVESHTTELGLSLTCVYRKHNGKACVSQTRNNAIREILKHSQNQAAYLVFLDGDMLLPPNFLESHAGLATRGDLVIGGRILLTPEETDQLDPKAIFSGTSPIAPDDQRVNKLSRRQKRLTRQAWWRRVGLARRNFKPSLIGCNAGIWLDAIKAVNGFDEQFQGWGSEDSDLGRRIYNQGGKPVVGISKAYAYHCHHPSRIGADPSEDGRALKMLETPRPTFCESGLNNPAPQASVKTIEFGKAKATN